MNDGIGQFAFQHRTFFQSHDLGQNVRVARVTQAVLRPKVVPEQAS